MQNETCVLVGEAVPYINLWGAAFFMLLLFVVGVLTGIAAERTFGRLTE